MAGSTLPLPAVREFVADPSWQAIEFLSDLHLAQDTPLTAAAFERYLRSTRADAVFILGDLFEAWVGDDARFDGFDAQVVAWLTDAARHRTIGFMQGNRDFMVGDALLNAIGAVALPDPTVLVAFDQRLLLSHGDALCLSDHEYQRFRAMVRDTAWQQRMLAAPLSDRRKMAGSMRSESEKRKQSQSPDDDGFDIDVPTAVQWMHAARSPVILHGHTHRPGSEPLAPGLVRHVLSDWELDHRHGPPRAEIMRWDHGGLTRVSLLPGHADAS